MNVILVQKSNNFGWNILIATIGIKKMFILKIIKYPFLYASLIHNINPFQVTN